MDNPLLSLLPESEPAEGKLSLATVYSVGEDGLRLIFDGQTEATQKSYKQLASYSSPTEGDRVVVMKMSGTCIVMGVIGNSGSIPTEALPIVPISKGGTGQTGVTITQDASEIVTAATGWNVTSAAFCQWGKAAMVQIDIRTTESVTVGTDTTIATIASGKRPAAVSPAQVWLTTTYRALISTDGALRLGRASAALIQENYGFTILAVYLLP